MSSTSENRDKRAGADDCARLEQILLDARGAGGGQLTAEERAFEREHLRVCADCRTEHEALALLAEDDHTAGAAPALDELARRRMINQVMARAARPAASSSPAAPARRSSARVKLTVALAASVLLGTTAALVAHQFGASKETSLEPAPLRLAGTHARAPRPPRSTAPVFAKVLLQYGKATLDGAPMAATRTMMPGRILRVATGQMVLQLPMGSKMLLRSRSTIGLSRLDADRVRVHLRQGELLASVTRRGPGQVFEVQTPAGRVVVRGTYFSVRVVGGRTLLSVLEGRVRVVEHGGAIRVLTGGQATTLGQGSVRPVSTADSRDAARQGKLLALLGNGDEGASARVISHPAGATVAVNGTALGKTPLVAALYSGQHRLSVARSGYRTVRESLILRPGDVVLRDFHLGRRLLARANIKQAPERAAGAPAPAQDQTKNRLKLKELEQKVNTLKEKVFRSKKTLLELKAAAAGRPLSGSQLVVKHANEMGSAFKLVRAEYALDGARILLKTDKPEGPLAAARQLDVVSQSISPGEHTLGVHFVFRGHGYGIFPYFKGYKFDVRSSHSFTVSTGKRTTVTATAYEKGFLTKVEDLPAIKFGVAHDGLGTKD